MPPSSPDSTSGRSPDSPNCEVHLTPRTGSRDPRRHPFDANGGGVRRRLPRGGPVGADDRVLISRKKKKKNKTPTTSVGTDPSLVPTWPRPRFCHESRHRRHMSRVETRSTRSSKSRGSSRPTSSRADASYQTAHIRNGQTGLVRLARGVCAPRSLTGQARPTGPGRQGVVGTRISPEAILAANASSCALIGSTKPPEVE